MYQILHFKDILFQALSHTVAPVMSTLLDLNIMSAEAQHLVELILKFDQLFDVLSSEKNPKFQPLWIKPMARQ